MIGRFRAAAPALLAAGAALLVTGCGTARPIHRGDAAAPAERIDRVANPVPVVPTSRVEEVASPWLGTPYRYGGQGRNGIDCSAFAREVIGDLGLALPRTVRDQRKKGRPVGRGDMTAGDLVFFRLGSSTVNHVGIALDRTRFVHSSTSRGVVIDQLMDGYFARNLAEIRRVLEPKENR